MKLQRVEIESLRMYKRQLVITDFLPGLNVFAGPNGSGKSTLVTAIRAAFLERHRSGTVDHLRPRDDGSASPRVCLDFTVGEQSYKLQKTFLGRKRCSLEIGSQMFDGEEAEDHLATIFGYGYAGRGASRDEHWGIPGLLWIQQGCGHEIRDQVGYAGDHLQGAMRSLVGSIASTEGDAVIQKLKAQREVMVTAGRGEPRGPYLAARNELQSSDGLLKELDDQINRYRGQVDQLGALQTTYAALQSERPWDAFRSERGNVLKALEEAEKLAAEIQGAERAKTAAEQKVGLFTDRLRELKEVENDLVDATRAVEEAETALAKARESASRAGHALEAAESSHQLAQASLERARASDRRKTLIGQQKALHDRSVQMAEALGKATQAQQDIFANERAAAAVKIDDVALLELRQLHSDLRDASIRLENVGTRIAVDLQPGVTVHAGETELAGVAELLVVESTVIALPGLGTLSIRPGGDGLSELARRKKEAEAAFSEALAALGVESIEAAEDRQGKFREAKHQTELARSAFNAIAPQGVEALEVDLEAANQSLQEIEQTLLLITAEEDGGADVLDLEEANTQAQAAYSAWQDALKDRNNLESGMRSCQDAVSAATQARERLAARVASGDRQDQLKKADDGLVDAQSAVRSAASQLAVLAEQARGIDVPALRLDEKRLESSADQEWKRFESIQERLRTIRAEVQHVGADGLEEKRATLKVKREAQASRVSEFARQVVVLDHLLKMLETRRDAVQQQLLAPLQQRVDHYIKLVFPDQRLLVGAQLVPDAVVTAADKHSAGGFDEQSFGTREQLGLISRLAYADLLQQAGSPTLMILDDALVHSDNQRLDQLKRVIYDASQRHQVLLMTCHPDRWRDAGAPIREMAELAA